MSDRFTQLLELYDQTMEIEQRWFRDRFIQYVWHRDGELSRVEGITRSYLAGDLP